MKKLLFVFLFASLVFGATDVFYAVGQNSDDHKTGSPDITISSGVATFTEAQTATNMGVGDRITHAGGDTRCWIASKTSNTVWNVVTKLGANPTNVTGESVTSITHEYTSLNAAEAGFVDANHINNISLVAADVVVHLACYYDDGADNTSISVGGITTDMTRYVKIYTPENTSTECNQSQRHNGQWSANVYTMEITTSGNNQFCLFPSSDGTIVEGIQFKLITGGAHTGCFCVGFSSTNNNRIITIQKNIMTSDFSAGGTVNGFSKTGFDDSVILRNNVIYHFNLDGIHLASDEASNVIYQNTISDCASAGIDVNAAVGGTILIKNNAIFNNADDIFSGGGGTLTTDYNASDDLTGNNAVDMSPGGSEPDGWNAAVTDYTTNDFTIKDGGSQLYGSGTDLSGAGITDDIIGTSRPQNGGWDIGAFEHIGCGAVYDTTYRDTLLIFSDCMGADLQSIYQDSIQIDSICDIDTTFNWSVAVRDTAYIDTSTGDPACATRFIPKGYLNSQQGYFSIQRRISRGYLNPQR